MPDPTPPQATPNGVDDYWIDAERKVLYCAKCRWWMPAGYIGPYETRLRFARHYREAHDHPRG